MRRMSPRQARRMLQQMGMKMEELEGILEVVLRTAEKEIVVEAPSVAVVEMQGTKIFQVAGGRIIERPASTAPEAVKERVSEADVQLLVLQLGVSAEEARRALEEAKGSLAEAILKLQAMKRS
ncbi:nascent polypeptide-associated complex protein [Candidatus Bathyarchaeota archaeon]|nr:nascent polypeptide-associated complex protein [Candidatus Bathyarchaeota archaeon]